jgi:DNA repair protein SbcC/Rad50
MLLTRLYLRNFRVFEQELELDLPPGLVGIYGHNGSGKSTLLEAILFTLWGKARTARDDIRTAGVGADCVTELQFEHEGHLYLVRRSLSGINATARAEVHCDGLLMSEGIRDTARYLHSVLGMDDGAFRASVFAEQKQLAAFSDQAPAERRRLVLQLLGITPLDAARDAARRDAKAAAEQHIRLRSLLPDLGVLRVEADDAKAQAAAAQVGADEAAQASAVATRKADDALTVFTQLDALRVEYDALVADGRAARQELDQATQAAADLNAELAALRGAAEELARLEPSLPELSDRERDLERLRALERAKTSLAAIRLPPEPPPADEAARAAAQKHAEAARDELVRTRSLLQAAEEEVRRAQEQAERSASLSGEADCPLCGQPLGAAFETVRAHREDEVAACRKRVQQLAGGEAAATETAATAVEQLQAATAAFDERAAARVAWEQQAGRRHLAEEAVAAARVDVPAGLLDAGSTVADLEAEVDELRRAGQTAERLRGRLERGPAAEAALRNAEGKAADAEARVVTLREKVKGLGFDAAALDAASRRRADTAEQARLAAEAARETAVSAARASERAEGVAQRLADGLDQHARLDDLEVERRHLARVADLLSEFRNTLVASVGPRLAAQAAELFGELTDHEYDELQVDPETYQLQISDGGRVYGLERFSGSEVDLANLALRVAISEHVRFQSGGSVGLLVLDEVFGPLDEDRKTRMLLALERLRGRFRQVLVVTHDAAIKEQLPHALEVVKLPGRRATARLLVG